MVPLDEVRIQLLWLDAAGRPATGPEGKAVLKVGTRAFNAPGELGPGPSVPFPENSPVWRALHAALVELKAGYAGDDPHGLPVIVDARPEVPTQLVVSALNERRLVDAV